MGCILERYLLFIRHRQPIFDAKKTVDFFFNCKQFVKEYIHYVFTTVEELIENLVVFIDNHQSKAGRYMFVVIVNITLKVCVNYESYL